MAEMNQDLERKAMEALERAKADEAVLRLKSYEALEHLADGKSTKIIVPAELSGVATFGTALKEVMEEKKDNTKK